MRNKIAKSLCVMLSLLLASHVHAEDARDLCADRPGLGTPACTVSPGGVVGELGIGDWTRDSDAASRTDTLLAGEALLRIGLTNTLEGQVGWTAFGFVRSRDRQTGAVQKDEDIGDVTLALRQNLHNPDGSGFSVAVMPYASLPLGGAPIGAGDWGAGLILPVSYELTDRLSIALTPEVDAAVDADGHGRHLGYGSVAGIGLALTDALSASTEISLYRDEDPAGHSTETLLGLSAAWQPDEATQIDLGVNLGLNRNSPDSQIYCGIAHRF